MALKKDDAGYNDLEIVHVGLDCRLCVLKEFVLEYHFVGRTRCWVLFDFRDKFLDSEGWS